MSSLDNYATHKHPKVRAWLERHPRWTFHFTPTSSSWLNAVEGFFAKLTKRRLQTRRVPLARRPAGRHQPLRRRAQPATQAVRLDRRSRRNHRHGQPRASNVGVDPLGRVSGEADAGQTIALRLVGAVTDQVGAWQSHDCSANTARNRSKLQAPEKAPCSMTMARLPSPRWPAPGPLRCLPFPSPAGSPGGAGSCAIVACSARFGRVASLRTIVARMLRAANAAGQGGCSLRHVLTGGLSAWPTPVGAPPWGGAPVPIDIDWGRLSRYPVRRPKVPSRRVTSSPSWMRSPQGTVRSPAGRPHCSGRDAGC